MRLCRLNFDTEQRLACDARRIFRLRRLIFGIVFGRLRSGFGVPGEKPIHLSQASTLAPL
jgi:hypothetical protein